VGGAPRQQAQVEAFKIRNVPQNRETSQRATADVITFDMAMKWPGAQALAVPVPACGAVMILSQRGEIALERVYGYNDSPANYCASTGTKHIR
jgi:hypothetical protein